MSATELLRRACGWWTIGAALAAASTGLAVALRLNPPAFDVAQTCALVVAVALAVKVLAWVAWSGWTFGREERLLAFVMLAAIGFGWLGSREWIAEREFDRRVADQRADLARALHDLSLRLTLFVDGRDRVAPPRPRPATWQRDADAFDRFETETVRMYERRFGDRVRAAHDLATLRGLRDRDLDAFFRHPANEFQMRVVAKKLDAFSAKLAPR
jgi:hypothetical protein